MTRAQRLERLLEIGDLTQEQVAQASGYSQAYISQMLRSQRAVADDALAAAAQLARWHLEKLLKEVDGDDSTTDA